MVEGSEIFEQIKHDSQTKKQVITETNYILEELKDYRNLYSEINSKCKHCGGDMKLTKDRIYDKEYLQCEECLLYETD